MSSSSNRPAPGLAITVDLKCVHVEKGDWVLVLQDAPAVPIGGAPDIASASEAEVVRYLEPHVQIACGQRRSRAAAELDSPGASSSDKHRALVAYVTSEARVTLFAMGRRFSPVVVRVSCALDVSP